MDDKFKWSGIQLKKLARRLKEYWVSPFFFEIFPDFMKQDAKVEYYFRDSRPGLVPDEH